MKFIFLFSVFFLLLSQLMAREIESVSDSSQSKPEITVGMWIDQLGNLDYENNTCEIIAYVWVTSEGSKYDLENSADFTNSWENEILYYEIDSVISNGKLIFNELIKVKINNISNFKLNSFPFDTNEILINVELTGHFTGDLKIAVDQINSIINPSINPEWKISQSPLSYQRNIWNSDYGNLREIKEVDAIQTKLVLKRNAWPIYFKLFSILFLAFILASLSFFLPNQKSEEKVAIVVGALFTAIGNKYITESIIPMSNNFGLSDQIHFTTLFFILLIIMFAIYEQRKKIRDSIFLDITIFTTFLISYVVTIILITKSYMIG
ncbi:MAG: hypothetical protein FJX80_04380 [Bacteroidetes bacterium]|nr:hypothetical protein [Bacteroidota bacterium]